MPLPAPADQSNNEGDPVSLAVSASDSIGGRTLTYSATGLPAPLTINRSTGLISVTLAPGAALAGPFAVTVVAQDSTFSASEGFTWSVSNPFTIDARASRTFSDRQPASRQLTAPA